MPECTEQLSLTIPIIRYTMEPEDRSEERQPTKKMSLVTTVKIETPDSGRRLSEPTRYYIPPQCNNRLSPRSARKRDARRNSKSDLNDDSPPRESLGLKPCNCEDCRASSPLPPGYGPHSLSPGYDQMKISLLEVPWNEDYTEASSDDLSSEWDSDVPDPPPPTHKVIDEEIPHLAYRRPRNPTVNLQHSTYLYTFVNNMLVIIILVMRTNSTYYLKRMTKFYSSVKNMFSGVFCLYFDNKILSFRCFKIAKTNVGRILYAVSTLTINVMRRINVTLQLLKLMTC